MKTKFAAAAVVAAAAPLTLAGIGTASAQSGTQTFTANLRPVALNGQNTASGTLTLTLNGDRATIHEQVSGLASTFMGGPFPHVQHIHGDAQGTCPSASADHNGDGVIDTSEAQPDYGPILTTLSRSPGGTSAADGTNVKIAPSGSSFTYSRTIALNSKSLAAVRDHNAVIVVHGLNPATAPKAATKEKSELPGTKSLPLAATAPAICGALQASPVGAAQTGAGGTSGVQDSALFVLGGGLILAAGGTAVVRRRSTRATR
jgi:hypothetical protein